MLEIPRRIVVAYDITGANGNVTSRRPVSTISSAGVVLDRYLFDAPMRGYIRNVKARLSVGGWTFSSMRVKIGTPYVLGEGLPAQVNLWSSFGDEHLLADSGVLASGLGGSATDTFYEDSFDDKKQSWERELLIGAEWATSAGSGTTQLVIACDVVFL